MGLAEMIRDRREYPLQIENKAWPVVMLEPMERILSVVAEIKQDEVVALAQQLPKGQVAVDRKPVAVAQREARTVGVAMTTQADYRAVLHRDIDRAERSGNGKRQTRRRPPSN